jgi:predicted nucleotidyltransferase
MTELSDINTYAQEIAKRYSPEKIILFGSHARGDAGKYSDVDLLVLMDYEGSSFRKAIDIKRHIPFQHPLDLIIKKPNDFWWRIQHHDFFLQEILDTGIVMYESAY